MLVWRNIHIFHNITRWFLIQYIESLAWIFASDFTTWNKRLLSKNALCISIFYRTWQLHGNLANLSLTQVKSSYICSLGILLMCEKPGLQCTCVEHIGYVEQSLNIRTCTSTDLAAKFLIIKSSFCFPVPCTVHVIIASYQIIQPKMTPLFYLPESSFIVKNIGPRYIVVQNDTMLQTAQKMAIWITKNHA